MTDLGALSDAATQGEWGARLNALGADVYSHPYGYVGAFTSNSPPMPHTQARMQADAAFVAALANAYRSGDLIPRSDLEAAVLAEREAWVKAVGQSIEHYRKQEYDAGPNMTQKQVAHERIKALLELPAIRARTEGGGV